MELAAGYLKSDFRYNFTGWTFLKDEWYVLGLSFLLGVVAALIPAIHASRTYIHQTLSV
jgi:ABC-type lipoprotein release transport system permease subunit